MPGHAQTETLPRRRRSRSRARRPGRRPGHRRHRAGRGGGPSRGRLRSKLSYCENGPPDPRSVAGSDPPDRPSPTSTRPGCSSDSVAACSAATSGAWLRIITPPAPKRIRRRPGRRLADQRQRRAGRDVGSEWCSVNHSRWQPSSSRCSARRQGLGEGIRSRVPADRTGAESSTPNLTAAPRRTLAARVGDLLGLRRQPGSRSSLESLRVFRSPTPGISSGTGWGGCAASRSPPRSFSKSRNTEWMWSPLATELTSSIRNRSVWIRK